jgi:hypothetical protein
MIIYPTRADRYALEGFTLGALSFLALLAALSLMIVHWPPGLEGPGAVLSVATFPVSLIGSLLSRRGRASPTWRGLALAGMVLSVAVALVILGFWILVLIELNQTWPERE